MKKMEALQEMIKNSQPNAEADDVEQDDEFDSYMEASLMQDSENPFKGLDGQAAGAEVYEAALKQIKATVPKDSGEEEVKGAPRSKPLAAAGGAEDDDQQQDLDQFGEDIMSKMMQDESNYVAEYNEVIAEISKACALI